MKISPKTNNTQLTFKRIFKYILFLIPIGVIGNAAFCFLTTDKNVILSLKKTSFEYLLIALVLGVIPWFTNTVRLNLWTRFLGKKYSFSEQFSIVLGTELGSAISPTAVGGGYVKLGMLIQKGMSPGASASLVVLASVEDALFFALTIPVFAVLTSAYKLPAIVTIFNQIKNSTSNIFIVTGIIAGTIISLIILRNSKYGRNSNIVNKICLKIKKTWTDFINVYRLLISKGKWIFVLSMFFTAVQWTARYTIITVILMCFNVPLHPVKFFIFQWVVFTLAAFIPTPGGAVGVEASFYLIYSAFIPIEILGIVTVIWRFLTYYSQLCIGSILFSILNLKKFREKKIKTEIPEEKRPVNLPGLKLLNVFRTFTD